MNLNFKLYKLFSKVFKNQLESDFDIERRLAVKAIEGIYQSNLERGLKEEKEHYESLVDNMVTTKFSQLNYSVNPLHVFQVNRQGLPYLGLEPIDRSKAEQLKGEAGMIQDTLLYDVLDSTLRNEAIKQGLLSSTEWNHILGSKQLIFSLDIIKGIIDKMSNLDLSKIPEKVDVSVVK